MAQRAPQIIVAGRGRERHVARDREVQAGPHWGRRVIDFATGTGAGEVGWGVCARSFEVEASSVVAVAARRQSGRFSRFLNHNIFGCRVLVCGYLGEREGPINKRLTLRRDLLQVGKVEGGKRRAFLL